MPQSTWRWIRAAAILLTIYLAYQLLVVTRDWLGSIFAVVLYLLFGGIVAYVVRPVVRQLQQRFYLPKTVAILIVLAGLLLIAATAGYLIAGPAVSQAQSFARGVPSFVDQVNSFLAGVRTNLQSHNINVGNLQASAVNDISGQLSSLLVGWITGAITTLVDILIVLVVAFWLLKDGSELRRGAIGMLPAAARGYAGFFLDAVGVVIGGYARAQLLTALLVGTVAGIGCGFLGVPFPFVIGIAVVVFELIPLVGPFLGGAVAVFLAATQSPGLAVATIVLFLGIHIIEGYVVVPRLQARFIRIHPLVALLALFAGIEIGGFIGAIFAVPVASLVTVMLRAAVEDWRSQRPDLFVSSEATESDERRAILLQEFASPQKKRAASS